MMRKVLMVALVVALAGCGSAATPSTTPPSTPTPSPTPSKSTPAQYADLTTLRDDAIAAGMECPSWDQHNNVTKALASGSCSEADVLSIYLDSSAVQEVVVTLKQISPDGVTLLVGPTWIINHSDVALLERLRQKLGGTVVTG